MFMLTRNKGSWGMKSQKKKKKKKSYMNLNYRLWNIEEKYPGLLFVKFQRLSPFVYEL